MSHQPSQIVGEKLHRIEQRASKPRLIHYTHDHRVMMIDLEGYPAVCEAVMEWRIIRKES